MTVPHEEPFNQGSIKGKHLANTLHLNYYFVTNSLQNLIIEIRFFENHMTGEND